MAYIKSEQTTVQIDDTTPGTADVEILGITGFSGLDGEADEVERTTLKSTAKEFRLGLQDFGNFSMDILVDYSDSGQTACRDAQASGEEKTFLITYPDASTATFVGYVKNAQNVTGGNNADVTGSISVRINGDVTFA